MNKACWIVLTWTEMTLRIAGSIRLNLRRESLLSNRFCLEILLVETRPAANLTQTTKVSCDRMLIHSSKKSQSEKVQKKKTKTTVRTFATIRHETQKTHRSSQILHWFGFSCSRRSDWKKNKNRDRNETRKFYLGRNRETSSETWKKNIFNFLLVERNSFQLELSSNKFVQLTELWWVDCWRQCIHSLEREKHVLVWTMKAWR